MKDHNQCDPRSKGGNDQQHGCHGRTKPPSRRRSRPGSMDGTEQPHGKAMRNERQDHEPPSATAKAVGSIVIWGIVRFANEYQPATSLKMNAEATPSAKRPRSIKAKTPSPCSRIPSSSVSWRFLRAELAAKFAGGHGHDLAPGGQHEAGRPKISGSAGQRFERSGRAFRLPAGHIYIMPSAGARHLPKRGVNRRVGLRREFSPVRRRVHPEGFLERGQVLAALAEWSLSSASDGLGSARSATL